MTNWISSLGIFPNSKPANIGSIMAWILGSLNRSAKLSKWVLNEFEKVKKEGDKSYELGANRKHPDLVIEVVVGSGGINKLEAYKRLQIPEVWFWMNDELLFYSLGNDGHEAVSKSPLLPSLDVGLLMRCINTENHAQALREFRAGIKIIEPT